MTSKYIYSLITISIIVATLSFSCKKYVEVDAPKTEIIRNVVFENDRTAKAALSAMYAEISASCGGSNGLSLPGGFLADESNSFSTASDMEQMAQNNILPTNQKIAGYWGGWYSIIYQANAIIEGLSNSAGVSLELKNQLEGEAKVARAFYHFYLVNLFGSIPYINTTDYRLNTVAPRMDVMQVYQEIIKDLKDAQTKLADDYSFSNNERARINKSAATALLARAYLYNGDWANAEIQATAVINKTDLYDLEALNLAFLKNSNEAIWQLLSVNENIKNTLDGNIFILTGTPGWAALKTDFVNSFEAGDNRRTNWIGSINVGIDTFYYPYKYKLAGSAPLDEHAIVLRVGEQYLVRAEARAQLNDISGAQADLNAIRNRAGLSITSANDKSSLLLAIEKERRVELFSEWAHRWLDLKRTGRVEAVLSPLKIGWQSTDALFPIPESEVLVNPTLTQNPGY